MHNTVIVINVTSSGFLAHEIPTQNDNPAVSRSTFTRYNLSGSLSQTDHELH